MKPHAALRARLSEITWELAGISRQGPKVRRKLAGTRRELEDERRDLRAKLSG